MNKKLIMIGLFAVAVVLVAGSVSAFGWHRSYERARGMQEGENIVEDGTFADLQAYREETQRPVTPWVQNEEDFSLWQEMHERMEQYREENDATLERQGNRFRQDGRFGGCPMAD